MYISRGENEIIIDYYFTIELICQKNSIKKLLTGKV